MAHGVDKKCNGEGTRERNIGEVERREPMHCVSFQQYTTALHLVLRSAVTLPELLARLSTLWPISTHLRSS